jgi:hypothetical protein|nr:MAG TPA: hypothetical protein [Caudoviricetes sp.]
MKLLQLYEALLQTAGFTVSEDGAVSTVLTGKEEPTLISGKRLVIPTRQQQMVGDFSNRVMFHPMAENIMKGETTAMSRFRTALNMRINLTVAALLGQLAHIASSTELQAKLDHSQTHYITGVDKSDDKTELNIVKLISNMDIADASTNFVRLSIKRSAVLNGNKHIRGCIVDFPLLNELKAALESGKYTVQHTKLRKQDVVNAIALLEAILPRANETDEDAYSVGVNTTTAPTVEALMLSVYKLVKDLNKVVSLFFEKGTDEYNAFHFRTDWYKHIKNASDYAVEIRTIPSVTNEDDLTTATGDTVAEKKAKANKVSAFNKPLKDFDEPVAATEAVTESTETKEESKTMSITEPPRERWTVKQPVAPQQVDIYGRPIVTTAPVAAAPVVQQPMAQPAQQVTMINGVPCVQINQNGQWVWVPVQQAQAVPQPQPPMAQPQPAQQVTMINGVPCIQMVQNGQVVWMPVQAQQQVQQQPVVAPQPVSHAAPNSVFSMIAASNPAALNAAQAMPAGNAIVGYNHQGRPVNAMGQVIGEYGYPIRG